MEAVKALAKDIGVVTRCVEDIEYYHNDCRVNVVPTRFAPGKPLKVIEALAFSIPTIVSPVIYRQLPLTEGKVLVANSKEKWIEHILTLCKSHESVKRSVISGTTKNESRES